MIVAAAVPPSQKGAFSTDQWHARITPLMWNHLLDVTARRSNLMGYGARCVSRADEQEASPPFAPFGVWSGFTIVNQLY